MTQLEKKRALLLLPNLLGDLPHHEPFLPKSIDKAVKSLDGLIAESETAGRRFLGRFELEKDIRLIPISVYNKDTPDKDIDFLLEPISKNNERWGLISDAGLPCVADPGGKLVYRARRLGIPIQAFVGPSSIYLALMLSGLQGQRFCFHGYLPFEKNFRIKALKNLEKKALDNSETQIFIETGYRNNHLLEDLIATLSDGTLLSIMWDISLPTQGGGTYTVAEWKASPLPNLHKRFAIFLVGKPW